MKFLLLLPLLLLPGLASAEPVSAIAAIASMAASGAAGAVVAGTALTLAQGLALASSALTLVGGITGNKKLSQLGSIVGLAGGINALMTEGAKTAGTAAGTQALSQTAASPAAEVAAEAAAGTAGAEAGKAAAEAAGLGTADLGASTAQSSLAQTAGGTGSGAIDGARQLAEVGGANPAGKSLLDTLADKAKGVGKFIESNKEVVKLGAGLVSGAANAYENRAAQSRQGKFLRDQQAQFSNSVSGINPIDRFVNPNANVTVAPAQSRVVPRRPLVGRP